MLKEIIKEDERRTKFVGMENNVLWLKIVQKLGKKWALIKDGGEYLSPIIKPSREK